MRPAVLTLVYVNLMIMVQLKLESQCAKKRMNIKLETKVNLLQKNKISIL